MHSHLLVAFAGMLVSAPSVLDVARLARDRGKARVAAEEPCAGSRLEGVQARAADDARAALGIIAESRSMLRALREAEVYAHARIPVVLAGPSGSGKTLLAKYIHARSSGRDGPFVPVTGAELPETLAESRLFGHLRGAFTDARESREGLITEAAGGTLFLDDAAWMPLSLQPKLLRALEGAYRPVGASMDLRTACRFVFGLRAEPDALVEQGTLLEDLRSRMGECVIGLQPLAERREDIGPLARRFLTDCPQRTSVGDGPGAFTRAALAALEARDWPRNVRELRGTVERAYLHARAAGATEVTVEHLGEQAFTARFSAHGDPAQNRLAVREGLAACGGRRDLAARLLGVHRNTVTRYTRQVG